MGFCFLKPLWCPLWFLYDSTYVFQVKKNFSFLYSQVSTCSRLYWGVLMLLTVHTITYLDVYVCSTSNGNMWCLVHHCMDFPLQSTFHISLNFFKLVFCGFGQGLSTRHAVIIQRLEKGKIIIFDIFFLGNQTVLLTTCNTSIWVKQESSIS